MHAQDMMHAARAGQRRTGRSDFSVGFSGRAGIGIFYAGSPVRPEFLRRAADRPARPEFLRWAGVSGSAVHGADRFGGTCRRITVPPCAGGKAATVAER